MVSVVLCHLPESAVLGMAVPRMPVQGVLVCRAPVPGTAVPRTTVQLIPARQVPRLVVLVTTPVTAVPLEVLFGLFQLGCLTVQVYFFPLECHLVPFLVFSKQNKTEPPVNIVAI